jgi:hypothetical protein
MLSSTRMLDLGSSRLIGRARSAGITSATNVSPNSGKLWPPAELLLSRITPTRDDVMVLKMANVRPRSGRGRKNVCETRRLHRWKRRYRKHLSNTFIALLYMYTFESSGY